MNKSETLKYIGNLSQLGYCRHYTLEEGRARGMRAADINNGSGLQYTVLPDRGMDISLAAFRGLNLVYQTCNGETHPSYFEPEGIGWLRTFGAGLLTTYGLTYLGSPCIDEGEQLGLHGRYSTIPVSRFTDLSGWEEDNYIYKLKGTIEEGYIFGNKLRLEREISSVGGQNRIHIKDTVTNFGSKPGPYTVLYHMNFGYPMLTEDAELLIEPSATLPRDADAIPGLDEFRRFIKPQPEYREQVFYHTMKGDINGDTSVILKNRKAGISVVIRFNIKQLPYVNQWKMMGYGEYVLGIEPSNVLCKSRNILREEKILPMLQPGESTTNNIDIEILDLI